MEPKSLLAMSSSVGPGSGFTLSGIAEAKRKSLIYARQFCILVGENGGMKLIE